MSPVPVVVNPIHGYRQLEPIPDSSELDAYYESSYYDLIRRGGRAPELARLIKGGPDAERDRNWRHATVFADAYRWLSSARGQGTLLEVGSGMGEFLDFMVANAWNVIGLELSEEAASACIDRGLDVRAHTLHDFLANDVTVDAIVLFHVLEHVPDPEALLRAARTALEIGGDLIVQVPNDFNALQRAALATLEVEPWWVVSPDHVNYFDFGSLRSLLESCGFEVVNEVGTFPMELFLLMGDDYVSSPELGAACHARRVQFELALDDKTRRALGRAWAAAGLGRACLVHAVAT